MVYRQHRKPMLSQQLLIQYFILDFLNKPTPNIRVNVKSNKVYSSST